jgi:hypothetical protein
MYQGVIMKKYALLLTSLLTTICLQTALIAAQETRNDRVCVFRDNNFSGREQCYFPGQQISNLKGAEVSSVRVSGRARVVLYENRDFGGSIMELSRDESDLARVWMSDSKTWNDRVGSLRVLDDNGEESSANGRYGSDNGRDGRNNGRYGSRRDRRPGAYGYPSGGSRYPYGDANSQGGVCVYDRPNFQGRSQCWSSGVDLRDLGAYGWSDRIQSVRVVGDSRVTAYRDIRFRGQRVVIDRDSSNLAAWNRQISSLQIDQVTGYSRRRR